ncbi:hypothetical protein BH11PSE12_BH11PSE12_18290 [soil metagenome]
MNKQFFKQFAIALVLFLLGYFTFNSKLFASECVSESASESTSEAVAYSEMASAVPSQMSC